jgi:hypothetical protein
MYWLTGYSTVALLVCVRLLYYTSKELDWADWQINRSQILNKVMFRVFLWPFFLIIPKQLIKPVFKYKPGPFSMEDEAALARKHAAFMNIPPPCGRTISLTGESGWSTIKGEFLFPSHLAQEYAVAKWRADKSLPGIRGAIWWLALRDDNLGENTPVPEMLRNFDKIAQDMIDAGVGQARCPECNKIFEVTEIITESRMLGSSGYKFLNCPNDHFLMSYEYIHFCFKRPDSFYNDSKDTGS